MLFDLSTRTDVQVSAQSEREYFAAVAQNMKPVQAVSIVMTVMLVLGGVLAGMNTMFNSIVGRTKEMAVLMVLGYRRRAILLSFVLEIDPAMPGRRMSRRALRVAAERNADALHDERFHFCRRWADRGHGAGAVVLIGVLGALAPVARVARMQAVAGLRGG